MNSHDYREYGSRKDFMDNSGPYDNINAEWLEYELCKYDGCTMPKIPMRSGGSTPFESILIAALIFAPLVLPFIHAIYAKHRDDKSKPKYPYIDR